MIGKVIEDTQPYIKAETPFTYHAVSKDWITNEIFRRVEPKGRTMGEYFEQELKDKYTSNVYLRMNKEDLSKYYNYKTHSLMVYHKNAKLSLFVLLGPGTMEDTPLILCLKFLGSSRNSLLMLMQR